MDGEGSKGLSGPLTETDITDILRLGNVEDISDRIRDIMPGEVIHRVVPKLFRVWIVLDALFRIFVASVIPQPDVEPKVDQNEGEGPFRGRQTDPHLRVHEQPVVEVHDRLVGPRSDRSARSSLGATETVQAEQVPILCEHDVFLELVTPN